MRLTDLSPCGSCGYKSANLLKGPLIVLIVLNGLLLGFIFGFIFGFILPRTCTMRSTTRAVLAPPATVSVSFCGVLPFFAIWSPTVRGMHAGAKGSAVPSLAAPVAAVPVALGRVGYLLAAISLALWFLRICTLWLERITRGSTTCAVLAPPATVSVALRGVLLFLASPTFRGMHAGAKGSALPSLAAPVAAVPMALSAVGHFLAAIFLALWGRAA